MKLNTLSTLQFLAMLVMPVVIASNTKDDAAAVVWSCVVIALLFIGVSIVFAAQTIAERN